VGAVASIMIVNAILKQFIAGTVILLALSGWGYETALLVSAAVVLVYLVLGGFASVVKTDIFQYLVLVLFMAMITTGAVTESHLSFADITHTEGSPTLAVSFFVYGFLSIWFLNEIWQRMYAAASGRVVRRGLLISGAFILATNITKDGIINLRGKSLSEQDMVRWTRASIIGIIIAATGLAYVFRDIIDVALINVGLGMSVVPSIAASLRAKPAQAAVVASIIAGLAATAGFVVARVVTPESMVGVVLVSAAVLGITHARTTRKHLLNTI